MLLWKRLCTEPYRAAARAHAKKRPRFSPRGSKYIHVRGSVVQALGLRSTFRVAVSPFKVCFEVSTGTFRSISNTLNRLKNRQVKFQSFFISFPIGIRSCIDWDWSLLELDFFGRFWLILGRVGSSWVGYFYCVEMPEKLQSFSGLPRKFNLTIALLSSVK